ncbi:MULTISPECIES: class II aldolase/adducin family protein [Pseudomonas]|jgi:ribulose-5-phosphate 4-epimerase/fuculose-1-phosphate aldolase|uniref:Aldolase n=1 Tax=Pseudomonas syringae TaxID=317 RepID=A0A085V7Z2_PSESX|nr:MULTISPECIES: class II aldolase/adducin family protein [Pseudomonas]EPJ85052.1 class II aldolase/adducin family protein [Pseudomonas sp. CFII64]KFE51555.1 aldolase [Pseudomonas syringae]
MSHASTFSKSIFSLPHSNNRLTLDAVPRHDDLLQERLHRKQRLAASYRLFAQYGFEVGLAGHFTARDPIETEHYWINPLGVPFSQISVSQLLRVDSQGQVVEGEGLLNTSALELHYGLQQARPEVVGIAHLHGFYGRTWSSLGQLFDPITAEAGAFVGDQAIFRRHDLRKADGTLEQDRDLVTGAFVDSFAGNNLLFWQNHGVWTVGETVESAAWRFILAEDVARSHLLARAAGVPIIPQVEPASVQGRARNELFSWLNFQPLWDEIIARQPDLLA